LSDHPDVLKQWYDFEERHYLNLAEDWLDSRGLLQRAKYSPASKALKSHAPEAD